VTFLHVHEYSTTIRIAVVIEFTILVVSLVGIRRASQHRETQLARLLKTQGVAYFAMVVLVHTTVVVSGSAFLETDIR